MFDDVYPQILVLFTLCDGWNWKTATAATLTFTSDERPETTLAVCGYKGDPSVVSLSTEGRETFDSAIQLQHDGDFRIKHGLNNEKEIKVHLHNNNLMQRSSTIIAEYS